MKVFQEFLDVFLEKLFRLLLAREVDRVIELTPKAAPIFHVPYQHSLLETNELEAQIKDILEKGNIQPSKSPWGGAYV